MLNVQSAIQSLMQPKQQKIVSPLPKQDSPGGYNNRATDPALDMYYQTQGPTGGPSTFQPKTVPVPDTLANSPTIADDFKNFTTAKVPTQYAQLIADSARKNGIDPSLLASLLFTEHGFQPTGINRNSDGSYDRGMAQINSSAHPEISDSQANDPNFAIPWAAQTLGSHIKSLGARRGIVAYNTGVGGSMGVNPIDHPYYKKVTSGLSQDLKNQLGLK